MVTTILDYLDAAASRYPDRTAYRDMENSCSFSELFHMARAIGSRLGALNAPGRPVAVLMEKSVSMAAACLGVVEGGMCYCPVDISMPAERLSLILSVLEPAAVIGEPAALQFLNGEQPDCPVFLFEELISQPEDNLLLAKIRKGLLSSSPLYILFTSGSTGVPKGVVVSHSVVMNNMEWLETEYRLGPEDVLGNQAPFHFDVADHDLYCPLKFGCSAVLIPQEYFSFPARLIELLNRERVTAIFWVPFALGMMAAFQAFEAETPKFLRYVFFAGEVMPVKQMNYWRRFVPEPLYVNMYGSTETHITLYHPLTREYSEEERIPIGKPCGNVRVLVLEEGDVPVTPESGGIGELCILGGALSLGYYKNPELTKTRFTENPLNPCYPERMFRTGDLVRYNEDGDLVYQNRADHQIKRLGYRIELGEIEAAAGGMDGLLEWACAYDEKKQTILFFYTGEEKERKELSSFLGRRIPKYMMPGWFLHLDSMPRTGSGKIDRKGLLSLYQKQGN